MKPKDKPKYLRELRTLSSRLSLNTLLKDPDDSDQNKIINRIIAVLKDFDHETGLTLERRRNEFQKWARTRKRAEHSENLLKDISHFVNHKSEEIDVYEFDEKKLDFIKKKLRDEHLWIRSKIQGDEEHIFIGKREDTSGKKVHLIAGKTGELRIDPNDEQPSDLLKRIVSITTKEGRRITSTLEFEKEGLIAEDALPGPRLSVYPSNKRQMFLLEIYNSGREDIEGLQVKVLWEQPEKKYFRILESFIGESDDPLFAGPHKVNVLKAGETKFIMNVPATSVDKKLKIVVTGKGVTSNKILNQDFEIETPQQYPRK